MKNKNLFSILILGCALGIYSLITFSNGDKVSQSILLNESHESFLNKIKEVPFKSDLVKDAKLPVNPYNKRVYELTINPALGYPTTYKKYQLQQKLAAEKNTKNLLTSKAPGSDSSNPWLSIGPNDVGGRTRAAIFDLNDVEKDRVIAGGVSGGIWVHEDIDNPSQVSWTPVSGVPGNLSVSVIVQDKNHTQIMYAGTGESYTSGDVLGNGVYKSTDGGSNWTPVLQSSAISTTLAYGSTFYINGYFYVNDLEIWDPTPSDTSNNDEVIFAALGGGYNKWGDGELNSFYDVDSYGFFKSTDGGASWTKISLLNSASHQEEINDIEVNPQNNEIWISGRRNVYGDAPINFYSSSNGSTFTKYTPTFPSITASSLNRVEIEPSNTNTSTFYILTSVSNKAEIFKTTDSFSNLTKLNEPIDSDTSIPSTDFTRGQAFYDLEIEADPNDDNIIYVGGINWFRSSDGGSTWNQMSKWHYTLPGSYGVVHADQHGLYFRPGNSNQAIVVNDGGVAYCSSLSGSTSSNTFTDQEKDFITTQFYQVSQTPITSTTSTFVLGGTQDNGSLLLSNLGTASGSIEAFGGDGGYPYIDQVSGRYYITNYVYNDAIYFHDLVNHSNSGYISSNTDYSGVDFINPGALDSHQNALYVNGGYTGTSYSIARFTDIVNSRTKTYLSGLNSPVSTLEVSRFTTSTTTLFAGLDNGYLYKIENANTGSLSSTVLKDFTGSISDIELGTDENHIMVTIYNYGVTNIFYSTDGGSTWASKEGNLPDLPVWCILQNPTNNAEAIIGTDLGVWKSTNFTASSPNWTHSYNGMSDVRVNDLKLIGSTESDNRIVASTYGRGIYVGDFDLDVDTTSPTVTLTDDQSDTYVKGGDVVTISASFSEAMTATPSLLFSGINSSNYLTETSTSNMYTYTWIVPSGINISVTATASGTDLAGNSLSGNSSITYTVDNTSPTLILSDDQEDVFVNYTEQIVIYASISESVVSTPTISITSILTNTLMSSTATPTLWKYTWTIPNLTDTWVSATVSATDLAGNVYAGSDSITYYIDSNNPSVTLSHNQDDTYLKGGDEVTVTAQFSEVMKASPKINVTDILSPTVMTMGADASIWTYTFKTPSNINKSVTVSVTGFDFGNNAYVGTDSLTFIVDTLAPSVTLSHTENTQYIVANDVIDFSATFSEPMTATPTILYNGVTLGVMSANSSQTDWTYSWTVPSSLSGLVRIQVQGNDLSGNSYTGTESVTYQIYTTPSYIPTSDLISWYPFIDSSSKDFSGNANHGIKHNVTSVANRFSTTNDAYSFTGINPSYIEMNTNTSFDNISKGFTFSAWLFSKTGNEGRLIQIGNTDSHGKGFIVLNQTNGLGAAVQSGCTGCGIGSWGTNIHPTVNTWQFMVFRVDFSNGKYEIFLDGLPILSGQKTDTTLLNSFFDLDLSSLDADIGRKTTSAYDSWNGYIDDIGIWSRAITDTELTKINPPVISNLVLNEDNVSVNLTFNKQVQTLVNNSTPLVVSDFTLSISGGTASLTSSTPSSISYSNGSYKIGFSLNSEADGTEQLTILPVSNEIFDIYGSPASTSQQTKTVTLKAFLDDDNDGVQDYVDKCLNTPAGESVNSDGCSQSQLDADKDGVSNTLDNCPNTPNTDQLDTDGDGIGNVCDTDDDNDGYTDEIEAICGYNPLDSTNYPPDFDGDGVIDCLDEDDDNDGFKDILDAFPLNSLEWIDTDADGIGNNADTDDDNDLQLDVHEIQCGSDPLNKISMSADNDRDNIPDCMDDDDDNDGCLDNLDAFPFDASECIDTDGDGIGNNADLDDDGDMYSDLDELTCGTNPLIFFNVPADLDKDLIPDCLDDDIDGDGCLNEEDLFPYNPLECLDNDFDNVGDNVDVDDDNDGCLDTIDAFPFDPLECYDADFDGIGDNEDLDDNNDGFIDDKLFISTLLTPESNGLEATWKIINIENYPFARVTVYNLNGTVVFDRTNYDNTWRGTYENNSKYLPAGSYYYSINKNDGSEILTGWIYIVY